METKNKLKNGWCIVHRIAILLAGLCVFYPGLNPGRVTTAINRNVSLFTSSVSYKTLVGNLTRGFSRGWISESVFKGLMISCIILIIGIVLSAVGGCMSLGNDRMRYWGTRFPAVGSVAMLGGLGGILVSYTRIVAADSSRVPPNIPVGYYFYMALAVLIFVTSLVLMVLAGRRKNLVENKMSMAEDYHLFLLFLPFLVLAFVFSYLPLWGWRYAFFDYKAGDELTMQNFVGLKWFTYLFKNAATRSDIFRVMKNTLAMSGLGILTSWLPMLFAIMLTQVNSKRFRRIVQTFTTIPNFIGWVIVYAIALAIFSTEGFINSFLNNVMNVSANTNYLMSSSHMWLKMLLWGTWKGLGWSAIIYISSISGIDPVLYEAATVDGAGRFRKIIHVTVPQLMPTFFVLLLMSIAGMLSNGLDQYLVFSNSMNQKSIEVLDLYVYNLGIGSGQIPMSTVIGMAKSIISVVLLFGANSVSKTLRGGSII